MDRCLLLAALLAAVPAPAVVPAPERALTDPRSLESPTDAATRAVPIADLFFSRGFQGASWSPDGKRIVLSTNLTGRYNLWTVDAAGSWPVQLAQSEDAQRGAVFSPDGQWIVFESDHAGGEIFDLYAVPAAGGAVVDLTASDDVSETSALFSPDGATIALERRHKDAAATDIALLDWRTRQVRQLTHEATANHSWQPVAFSRDGRTLIATRYDAGDTDASAWRIDVESGKAQELTPHQAPALIVATALSPDGRTVAITTNLKRGHDEAALLDLATRKLTEVTHGDWDAQSRDFAPDGRTLAYTVNSDGRGELYLYEIDSRERRAIPFPPGLNGFASRGAFSRDGTRLLVSHQSSTTPADYWIVDRAGTTAPRQLTRAALASVDPAHLPAAQLVHYKSFDGTVISAFAWLPPNLARDGKAPAVVLPHGGPTGQTLDTFNRTAVALASRGFVCIAPNVRGSTGYGVAFQKSNYKDLGGGDLQDEVFAARFLVATGYVDAKKIGIAGGSYGGFMALMAVGRTPDDWAAAVDLFGVTNWLSEQEHEEPALQQYDQTLLGDPVKDRAVYERASPTTYFAQIKAPLLVLQGENDIRDPKEEAEQAFKVLRESGKTVDAHYYAGEGHGFAKRENQIDALERTVAWFERWLRGGGAVSGR